MTCVRRVCTWWNRPLGWKGLGWRPNQVPGCLGSQRMCCLKIQGLSQALSGFSSKNTYCSCSSSMSVSHRWCYNIFPFHHPQCYLSSLKPIACQYLAYQVIPMFKGFLVLLYQDHHHLPLLTPPHHHPHHHHHHHHPPLTGRHAGHIVAWLQTITSGFFSLIAATSLSRVAGWNQGGNVDYFR